MPETPEKPGKPELDFTHLEAAFRDVGAAIAAVGAELAAIGVTVRDAGHFNPCARTGCGHPRLQHAAGVCMGDTWRCRCARFTEAEGGNDGE